MASEPSWKAVAEAIRFASDCVDFDPDPLNDRERADGHRYLQFIVSTAAQFSLLDVNPMVPRFIDQLDSTRWLGASGPDIDYDVAVVQPGTRHRIIGRRGGSSYVGICVYANDGARGATAMVDNVDVDSLVDSAGNFVYEFEHPQAARVIIRQYFHDRSSQDRGEWTIERLVASEPRDFSQNPAVVAARIQQMVDTIRWNAQLNQLWGADLRDTPNRLVLQSAEEIVAAVPNPDVTYAFGWWRLDSHEALEVTLRPPANCRYWSLQVGDRWFQAHPDRNMNINDRQVTPNSDGTVTIVLAEHDPGRPNWLGTYGHTLGTMFFRWLHHTPERVPECGVAPVG
ncbi:MAG: hypothetical protein RIS41_2064 [Actinomycetota bacterium]|jgi:hypothetical protein